MTSKTTGSFLPLHWQKVLLIKIIVPLPGNVAYTVGNNLYVNENPVTDEPEGIVCGQSVHRNEFGIYKGTFWNPKGDLLAFYRMDESMVTQYPLVDITARIGEVNNIRYPMAE